MYLSICAKNLFSKSTKKHYLEVPKSYMHLHGKCTCSRCLMFVKCVATPKAPLGAMLRLRRSNEPGPPTAARFRVNVSQARFARAALCAVTNLT